MDNSPLNNEVVQKIATKQKKTPAQVLLRWGIQHGISILPKSVHEDRIKENANIFDFTLSGEGIHPIMRMQGVGWS